MNIVIIKEFEKLINFVQHQIDNSTNIKDKTANGFRLRQNKTILLTITKYPDEITLDNLNEFSKLPGIGKKTIDRIKEILNTGKLEELKDFNNENKEDENIINELTSIIGIGRVKAVELIKLGITSIKSLKQRIKKGEIELNEKIMLGIKYHGKFKGEIPRKEITLISGLIKSVINKLNRKLNEDEKYYFEICGSYRRGKNTSGDIDVLISKLGTVYEKEESVNHLGKIIQLLKSDIKKNNEEPLIIDDMTDKNFETKYMGFCKYLDNPVRRIDIRFVPHDVYPSALLYFTGSAELNKKMRQMAKTMGYKLSEYGLTKEDGTKVKINTEYDIFKILKIEYLEPKLR